MAEVIMAEVTILLIYSSGVLQNKPWSKKYDKNGKRSKGQLNYYLTFIYNICIYCTMTMAEVIFLTVRSEVMSLKRLHLRIYNYSVQITFLSKIPNYLTVINE